MARQELATLSKEKEVWDRNVVFKYQRKLESDLVIK